MRTKINCARRARFGKVSMTLRGSLIAITLTAFLVPAVPLSTARADEAPPSSSRLQALTGSADALEAAELPQRGVLDAEGKPTCAELGEIAQWPAAERGISGEFIGTVGCGVFRVYADAAPGADAKAESLDVATEVIWHLQWRTGFAYDDSAPPPHQLMIGARAH